MKYEFVAIPDEDVPAGRRPDLPARRHDLRQRDEQDGRRVAGRPRRADRVSAPREDQHDPGDPDPSGPLGAAVLRPVRRHRGAPGRGVTASRRGPARLGLHRPVRRLGEGPPAAARRGDAPSGGWRSGRSSAGCSRQRIWTFWRRVLHTGHHRTQVQTWLRLAGRHVPAIYGPSGDVSWDEADPTYSVEAAGRGDAAGHRPEEELG